MKSLQSLLAVREGHLSPQLQVLASMVGPHSRLGSITDKLAHALQTWQPLGELFVLLNLNCNSLGRQNFLGLLLGLLGNRVFEEGLNL